MRGCAYDAFVSFSLSIDHHYALLCLTMLTGIMRSNCANVKVDNPPTACAEVVRPVDNPRTHPCACPGVKGASA